MLFHAKNFAQVARALPLEPREVEKLPRSYLANVIYTIIGDRFRIWVDEKISERNQKIMQTQNLAINMDPEIYAAFQASTHVSVQHGISGHLMKASAKRRRTKAEIAEEKLETARKEAVIQERMAYMERMEQALEESERKRQQLYDQS